LADIKLSSRNSKRVSFRLKCLETEIAVTSPKPRTAPGYLENEDSQTKYQIAGHAIAHDPEKEVYVCIHAPAVSIMRLPPNPYPGIPTRYGNNGARIAMEYVQGSKEYIKICPRSSTACLLDPKVSARRD